MLILPFVELGGGEYTLLQTRSANRFKVIEGVFPLQPQYRKMGQAAQAPSQPAVGAEEEIMTDEQMMQQERAEEKQAAPADETYEVEKILDAYEDEDGNLQYEVSWVGYGVEHNCTVSEKNMRGSRRLVEEYWAERAAREEAEVTAMVSNSIMSMQGPQEQEEEFTLVCMINGNGEPQTVRMPGAALRAISAGLIEDEEVDEDEDEVILHPRAKTGR